MLGPRYLHAMAMDGYGPAALAKIHPRFRTPALAIITVGVLSLLLALSGSFVQLALLSVVARLCTYIGTSVSVLVRSEEHTSELQSIMRISYDVFCLKKKK